MFFGIITLSEFCRKYKLTDKQKTELVTMQAFHQGVAMLIGAGGVLILQAVASWILSVI